MRLIDDQSRQRNGYDVKGIFITYYCLIISGRRLSHSIAVETRDQKEHEVSDSKRIQSDIVEPCYQLYEFCF